MLWFDPIKSALGSFFSGNFHRVVLATYRSYMPDSLTMCNDMDLHVIYGKSADEQYVVRMYITRASGIDIATINQGSLRFDEVFIDDLSDSQMESVKYHFADEGGDFSFYCADVKVLGIYEFADDTFGRRIWPA